MFFFATLFAARKEIARRRSGRKYTQVLFMLSEAFPCYNFTIASERALGSCSVQCDTCTELCDKCVIKNIKTGPHTRSGGGDPRRDKCRFCLCLRASSECPRLAVKIFLSYKSHSFKCTMWTSLNFI